MIAVSGSSSRISCAACRPSVACAGGIRMSMIATSGLVEWTRASSSTPSPAWPTTSNPERSSRLARPSRSRTSSSASTTRAGRDSSEVGIQRLLRSPATQAVAGRSLAGARSLASSRGCTDDTHCVPRPRRPRLAARSLALARSHRRRGCTDDRPLRSPATQAVAGRSLAGARSLVAFADSRGFEVTVSRTVRFRLAAMRVLHRPAILRTGSESCACSSSTTTPTSWRRPAISWNA